MGKMAAALVCAVALLCLAACSDDGDSGGGGGDRAKNIITIEKYEAGTIIRNTVVNFGNTGEVYFEYLKFTSETGGEYSLYMKKSDSMADNEKVTSYNNRNGDAVDVPTTFTYDSDTGKLTAVLHF